MARSRESGKARTTARSVTAPVPARKGRKPNCPCCGFHVVEVSNDHKEWACRIGADLRYKPTPKAMTNSMALTAMAAIKYPAILSFQ